MKRTIGSIVSACTIMGIGMLLLVGGGRMVFAAEAKTKTATVATPAPVPGQEASHEQATPPGKVVYTFDDAGKLQEFTKFWQQRQTLILRMTALQSYWNQDQVALGELNEKITSIYKVDPAKNYFLDRERRVLIEREGSAPMPPTAPTGAPAPAEAAKH